MKIITLGEVNTFVEFVFIQNNVLSLPKCIERLNKYNRTYLFIVKVSALRMDYKENIVKLCLERGSFEKIFHHINLIIK